MPLAVEHLVSLELNGHVLDAKQTHRVVDVLEHVLLSVWLSYDAVRAHCDDLGPAKKDNAALVACLAADRRAEVEIIGAARELARTAKRAE